MIAFLLLIIYNKIWNTGESDKYSNEIGQKNEQPKQKKN